MNKDNMIAFRVTKDERLKLERAAQKSGMQLSEYLRALISVAPSIEMRYDIIEEDE